MHDCVNDVIELIRLNRISTTEVADALGKTGLLDGKIKPLNPRKFAVGKIRYVPAFNGSNWHVHRILQDIVPGEIALIDGVNCGERAIFGELVSKFVLLYRRAEAMVVKGYVRDLPHLIKENYSIWAYGATPIGCINVDAGFDQEYVERQCEYYEGGILVADDSGCVLIRKDQITDALIDKLNEIEDQEDVWFDAIDRLKLTTFETVCLKKYKTV